MLTIALIAQKGGTGKTTVARCLAVAFERSVQASAIIDMDPQASASLWAKRRDADLPEVHPDRPSSARRYAQGGRAID